MSLFLENIDLTRVQADLDVSYNEIPFLVSAGHGAVMVRFEKWHDAWIVFRSLKKNSTKGESLFLNADRALAQQGVTLFLQSKRFALLGLRSNRIVVGLLSFLTR